MKINWKKHAVFSLLQTCTSSMAAGVQLTVRMTDSFIIENKAPLVKEEIHAYLTKLYPRH